MKIRFCILLWIGSIANSYGQSPVNVKNYLAKTIVSGTVDDNWGEDEVKFVIKDLFPTGNVSGNFDTHRIIKCDKGKFKIEFEIDHPVYIAPEYDVWASIPPYEVFNTLSTRYISLGMLVEPGDSIVIQNLKKGVADNHGYKFLDKGSYFSEQTFRGRGAEKLWCIQNILRATQLYTLPDVRGEKIQGAERMLRFSDSVTTMILAHIEMFKPKLSAQAISIIKAQYIPMLAFDISEIVEITGLSIEDPAVKQLMKIHWSKADKAYNADNPGVEFGYFFSTILKNRALFSYAMDKNYPIDSIGYSKFKLNTDFYYALTKYLVDSPIKERIIGQYILTGLKLAGMNSRCESIISDYLTRYSTHTLYQDTIVKYLNTIKLKFSRGTAAYNFSLPDTSGKMISLSDFKGKVVVIDFMFTGCQGCLRMVPAMRLLEKKYNGNRDVVFISISISHDSPGAGNWRAGIGKFSVQNSIQLCAGGKSVSPSQEKNMEKLFNINSYPQLVVIDKNGALVTTNAIRPDSDNGIGLSQLINQMLNEGK
jgi:thiol-disulfide isomerase/thioredoxin